MSKRTRKTKYLVLKRKIEEARSMFAMKYDVWHAQGAHKILRISSDSVKVWTNVGSYKPIEFSQCLCRQCVLALAFNQWGRDLRGEAKREVRETDIKQTK